MHMRMCNLHIPGMTHVQLVDDEPLDGHLLKLAGYVRRIYIRVRTPCLYARFLLDGNQDTGIGQETSGYWSFAMMPR